MKYIRFSQCTCFNKNDNYINVIEKCRNGSVRIKKKNNVRSDSHKFYFWHFYRLPYLALKYYLPNSI